MVVILAFCLITAILLLTTAWEQNQELVKFIGYLIGGILLFLQICVSSQRATAAEKTADLTEKGNIAERFKNAIQHLGNESVSVRLGGIYALHHIAQEVKGYRERVFEILCAHIRETTTQEAYKPRINQFKEEVPAIEIQGILNLLFIKIPGRKIYEGLATDLEKANLAGARLEGADLRKADLFGADLQRANLFRADLQTANLIGAYLQEVDLQGAYLQEAYLHGADLQRANLQRANLQEAYLYGAYLIEAKNLEVEQLLEAKTLDKATLPEGMEEIIRQQMPELFENPSDEDDA